VAPFSGQCNLRFLSTEVLQGSVGTCVNYGRIFIDYFTANLLQSVTVKNFENRLEFRGVTGTFFRIRCTFVMLRIAMEVAGRVCGAGAGCSIFSQTVDRLLPLTADGSLASHNSDTVSHVCQKYYCTLFDRYSCVPTIYSAPYNLLTLCYRRYNY